MVEIPEDLERWHWPVPGTLRAQVAEKRKASQREEEHVEVV
jgi:electron transport complex protein RnfB